MTPCCALMRLTGAPFFTCRADSERQLLRGSRFVTRSPMVPLIAPDGQPSFTLRGSYARDGRQLRNTIPVPVPQSVG
jgi:hypothetical protein